MEVWESYSRGLEQVTLLCIIHFSVPRYCLCHFTAAQVPFHLTWRGRGLEHRNQQLVVAGEVSCPGGKLTVQWLDVGGEILPFTILLTTVTIRIFIWKLGTWMVVPMGFPQILRGEWQTKSFDEELWAWTMRGHCDCLLYDLVLYIT